MQDELSRKCVHSDEAVMDDMRHCMVKLQLTDAVDSTLSTFNDAKGEMCSTATRDVSKNYQFNGDQTHRLWIPCSFV